MNQVRAKCKPMVNFSVGIVPHPTMNLNLAYTYSKTDQSGGGQPSSSTSTHIGDVTLSYNPFRTLYLVAALEVLAENRSEDQNNPELWIELVTFS